MGPEAGRSGRFEGSLGSHNHGLKNHKLNFRHPLPEDPSASVLAVI